MGHCWRSPCRCANNVQPGAIDSDLSGQPFVTIGGGGLPLPMPTHPATLTATRVATKATSTFFHSPFFTPRDTHFVPRCTVGRPLSANSSPAPALRRATVSLGTHLRGVCSKTCRERARKSGERAAAFGLFHDRLERSSLHGRTANTRRDRAASRVRFGSGSAVPITSASRLLTPQHSP